MLGVNAESEKKMHVMSDSVNAMFSKVSCSNTEVEEALKRFAAYEQTMKEILDTFAVISA